LDLDRVDLVRAARVHRSHLPEEPALAAIGTLVEDERRAAGDELPVARDPGLEVHRDAFTTLRDRPEFFLAGEDQAHRTLRGTRDRSDLAFEVQVALRAEPATEQRDDDPHIGLRDRKRL